METAEKEKLSRISEIRLIVGKMRQIVPEIMQFAFKAIAADTVAKGALLVIKQESVRVECLKCSEKSEINDNIYICSGCGSSQLEFITGKELFIESIEGE